MARASGDTPKRCINLMPQLNLGLETESFHSAGQLRTMSCRGLPTSWYEFDHPNRPLVVLLHGYPDSPTIWKNQLEPLLREYGVLIPFIRGSSGSPSKPEESLRFHPTSILLDCLEILRHYPNRPLHLVGHDLGAVHAWNLAAHLGSSALSLTILSGTSLDVYSNRLSRTDQLLRAWYVMALQFPAVVDSIARFFPKDLESLLSRIDPSRTGNGGSPPEWNARQYPILAALALWNWVWSEKPNHSKLSVPLQVLWGKEDLFLSSPTQGEWERVATSATVRILPAGHWMQLQIPRQVNALLEKFLKAHDYRFPRMSLDKIAAPTRTPNPVVLGGTCANPSSFSLDDKST